MSLRDLYISGIFYLYDCLCKMKIFYKPFGFSDATIEKVQGGRKAHEERNKNGSL